MVVVNKKIALSGILVAVAGSDRDMDERGFVSECSHVF